MAHEAEIVHHVRGRVRMKVKGAKGDEALLEQIRQALTPIPGVREVSVNPDTGSVIMHYDPETNGEFHDRLQKHGSSHIAVRRAPRSEIDDVAEKLEQEAEFLAEHSEVARCVVGFCRELDRQVKLSTDNAVDLKVLVPLGLAAYTFIYVGVEAATPVWLTLGLFGLNHFVEMHAHPSQPAW
jgi:hypothetical protein